MENLTFCDIKVWVWFVALWVGFSWQNVSASGDQHTKSLSIASDRGMDPVVFTFNCLDGQPGDTICIPVTVENFVDITIFQFEIIWNSDVLDFIDIQNPGSPSINLGGDFNLSGPNTLKVIPLNFPIDGETLADGTVIFEICFRIVGIPGSSSVVDISPYFNFEVADEPSGIIPSDSVNCTMNVLPAVDLVGFVKSCGPPVAGGNGTIDLTVYGGMAPYTVTWLETITNTPGGPMSIPVEGGNSVLSVPSGNYNVIIADGSGGSVTYNIDVAALALSVETRLKDPTCYKFENGTMWIKPIGGTEPFSFIWNSLSDPSLAGSGFIRDAGDSSLITSLPDGMYHILVEDINGCRTEITSVLNDKPFIISVDDFQDATCNGSLDAYITLSVTGATPDPDGNYTFKLGPTFQVVQPGITFGMKNPGIYSITISDEISQCDTVFTFEFEALTTISATVTPTDPPCAGGVNGSVSLRGLTNGVAGPLYSYFIYQNGILESSATNIGGIYNYGPLAPGDYMAIVTEGLCVSDSIPFTIGNPLPMSVSVDGTSIDDCLDFPMFATGDAWFEITNGMGPYILSAGMGTQDGDTIQNLQAGNYTVTVTDSKGCTATAPFTIYDGADNEEADISFQIDGIPCEGGTVTVFFQGGPLPPGSSVTWSNDSTGQTITIDDIQGTDTIAVDLFMPNIHCILMDTVIINCETKLELDITVIQPLCNDEADGGPYTGTVIVDTANAVAPVTWIWSFPDTTFSPIYAGLSPGKYFVTVTDAVDSVSVDSFEIIAPPAIHLLFGVPDSTSCPDVCDGFVQITPTDGDAALDYFLYWTTVTPFADTGVLFQVNDLCAGVTEFSVSQDGLCFYRDEIEIFAPDPVEVDLVTVEDATCFGYSDGSLEVIASGGTPGYDYNWAGGPATPLYNNIGADTYFVVVTDANDCVQIDSFTVGQPDTLIAQIDISGTSNLSCGSSNDGIVTVNVSGGNSGNYSFQWNPDVSTNYQAVNLAAGDYIITVTDTKGCTDTTAYSLTSPPPINVVWPIVAPPACFGDETIIQIVQVSGGSGNYNFSLNGGESLDIGDPVMIPSGIYIVSVFDDRGCAADTSYTVIEPNPILVSIGPDDPIIDLGDSLFIIGQVDQSDNPISMFTWTSQAPVSCPSCEGTWVFNVVPTEYTWTVTDVNGCQGSASITVGVDFERDVYIPDVFTPNNDGRNDDFKIFSGPGVEKINYIYIYDRWGNLVYSVKDQLPSATGAGNWDGTNDGVPLNPGVYVFVAEITFIDNNTTLLYRGDITLLK